MAEVIINDRAVTAEVGEDLLSVARRNAAHIGFVCDGNGLCTTCESRVLSGAENLSAPNDVEQDWLPAQRIERGYRLACQTVVTGAGPVRLLTRAEELRRLWDAIGNPPAGHTGDEYLNLFLGRVVQLNVEYLSMFPLNLLRTVNRIGLVRTILPVRNNQRWLRDLGNVIDEQSGNLFSDASLNPEKVAQ